MALSIDYECPQCRKKLAQEFQDITPGKPRECTDCKLPVRLTDRSLQGFERSLREYCTH